MRVAALLLGLGALLRPACVAAQDGRWRADLWTGLGLAAMQDINDDRRHALDNAMPSVSPTDTALTWESSRLGTGLAIGVEGDWLAAEEWLVGARVGLVSAGTALNKFTYATQFTGSSAADTFSARHTYSDQFSASLVPLLLGGRYENHVASWLTVVTGAYAGLGLASGSVTYARTYAATGTGSFAGSSSSSSASYTTGLGGLGLGAEFVTGMRFRLSTQMSLGFDLGYRLLTVKAQSAKSVDLNGDGVLDGKQTYTLDFSGHLLAVTLGYAY